MDDIEELRRAFLRIPADECLRSFLSPEKYAKHKAEEAASKIKWDRKLAAMTEEEKKQYLFDLSR
jgi:hypothetical protein